MTDEARDVDLLRIELGVIWRLDDRGRLPGPETMVIGAASDGLTAAVAGHVPDDLATRLLSLITGAALPPPGVPPGVLADCRELLGGERVKVTGGPSYLVVPPLQADVTAEVLRSDSAEHVRLVRSLPRPASWEEDEWGRLTSLSAGTPWAMVADDGQVVSICHSARLTPAGAEAGTWTSPAYRGRGHAAATTSAWAAQFSGIHLFSSTSADNHSSQRVARRLGLRPLGWIWHLTT
ncbi:GNAT family N-acetyltransferase [Nonomuraea sp. FMUSA5-5]|uniref:GNAT family N-acetyltransferase n=1 Tax=Nonomuraea composti TaxID=2720023 RepID=A0ABX1B393_9ACTN|nr:GNAT family protein [Nonomuraea sp. FMUSA5-5]NJP90794.1 GNAT family N-acetyltransferase [Nonomuraea sp. FMUSA5-5]